jgi:hypothetical protein
MNNNEYYIGGNEEEEEEEFEEEGEVFDEYYQNMITKSRIIPYFLEIESKEQFENYNYQLSEMPPLFYREIIEKFKGELTKLPNLKDTEYDKKIEWYKIAHSNEAHLICNFILVQIAVVILDLSKLGPHGKALAEQLTASLIAKEKMFSKPDPFKFIIDKRTKDDEYATDTSSEGSDITDATEVESVANFEAESDTNEQNQETEAYNFGLEETGIDDINDGNDDEQEEASDAPAA